MVFGHFGRAFGVFGPLVLGECLLCPTFNFPYFYGETLLKTDRRRRPKAKPLKSLSSPISHKYTNKLHLYKVGTKIFIVSTN